MSEDSMMMRFLANHRAMWLVMNGGAMALHILLSKTLWHYDLKPGEIHSGGPGDGFYFFFILLLPWFFAGGVNIALFVLASIRRKPGSLIMLQGLLVGSWIAIALVEQRLMRIPQGVIDIGN